MAGAGPFYFADIRGERYSREPPPNECPICHFSVEPDELCWSFAAEDGDSQALLESVFRCPRRECGHLFIARYWRDDEPRPEWSPGLSVIYEFRLREAVPVTPVGPYVPDEVAAISPSFVEIYSQSGSADALGLDQIAGVGYRKSLEFLVKDYSISMRPSDADAIGAAPLARCIERFVDSPQVVAVAKRAAWLGNDETHYERRWEHMDIVNLKQLIQLTVNWIHSSLLTAKYEQEMPAS